MCVCVCVCVCVCFGTDVFCFLVCGSPALQTPSLEAVTLHLYVCVCVCVCVANSQRNTHTENVMCFPW